MNDLSARTKKGPHSDSVPRQTTFIFAISFRSPQIHTYWQCLLRDTKCFQRLLEITLTYIPTPLADNVGRMLNFEIGGSFYHSHIIPTDAFDCTSIGWRTWFRSSRKLADETIFLWKRGYIFENGCPLQVITFETVWCASFFDLFRLNLIWRNTSHRLGRAQILSTSSTRSQLFEGKNFTGRRNFSYVHLPHVPRYIPQSGTVSFGYCSAPPRIIFHCDISKTKFSISHGGWKHKPKKKQVRG